MKGIYVYTFILQLFRFFNRIHIETSSVLIRQLPIEFLQRPSVWCYAPTNTGMYVPASWLHGYVYEVYNINTLFLY